MPSSDAIPCPEEAVPERVRFFAGQLMTEADFTAEQAYHRAKHRSHNRYLHGSGVVCGLQVEATKPASSSVVVQPGVAIDCCGREILVVDPVVVEPRALLEKGRKRGRIYLTLSYGETAVEPIAAPDCDDTQSDSSRIRESARIGATRTRPVEPTASADRCPVCEQPEVLLAVLELSRRKRITAARIDTTVRPIVGADPEQAAMALRVEQLQRRVAELQLAVVLGAAGCLLRWWISRQQKV
jgi:hypothetical protein